MLSRNEATGETEARQVTGTTVHRTLQTVSVTLADAKTGEHQQIVCTPNHPFYVAGQGFTPAGSLGIGTSIVTRAGPGLAVSNVQFQPADAGNSTGTPAGMTMVYNLTVEGDHTYFVGTLGGGAWVHNKCFPNEAYTQVGYGSEELSQAAILHRANQRNPVGLYNVAVFKIRGVEELAVYTSGNGLHAEERGMYDLMTRGGLTEGNIEAVYSELHPCNLPRHNCEGTLAQRLGSVPVYYSFRSSAALGGALYSGFR